MALLLAAYVALDVGADNVDCSDFRFDATAWANDTDGDAWMLASEREEPTVRQRLAGELIECGTLVGKRQADLTRLLGEPDDDISWADGAKASSWVTGVERGGYVQIDYEHLLVRFDSAGRADRIELVTD